MGRKTQKTKRNTKRFRVQYIVEEGIVISNLTRID